MNGPGVTLRSPVTVAAIVAENLRRFATSSLRLTSLCSQTLTLDIHDMEFTWTDHYMDFIDIYTLFTLM